jgi:hypothetical protein
MVVNEKIWRIAYAPELANADGKSYSKTEEERSYTSKVFASHKLLSSYDNFVLHLSRFF